MTAGSPASDFAKELFRGTLTIQYDAATGRTIVTHAAESIEISRASLDQLVKHGWAQEIDGVLQFTFANVAYELKGRDPEGTSYIGTRIYQRVEIDARHLAALVDYASHAGGPTKPLEAGLVALKGYSEVGPK